jgi:hypothetical protein
MNSQLTSTIGTCGSIDSQGSIGTCGSIGITGLQGTTGPRGYQITDWKEDMMKKYPRFTIKTEYDPMTMFTPSTLQIIDNNTGEEYKFMSIILDILQLVEETDLFIKQLIVTIREDKINTIINGTES